MLNYKPNLELTQKMILEKDLFKPRNNLVFGKVVQNKDLPLVTSERTRNKQVALPRQNGAKHISNNLQIFKFLKNETVMDEPTCNGQTD